MAESKSNPTPRKRKRRKSRIPHIIGIIFKVLGTLLLTGICTGVLLACFAAVYVKNVILPQADQVLSVIGTYDINQSSTMYYTDKHTGAQVEMLTLHGEENRVWIEFKDIPQNLINATIAIEDKRFEEHGGVDWIRTAYGMLSMFTGRDIQGGSTITQQLIKNITQNDEVTVKRKILEIFTALEFEKEHSKDEILEWYLNYIYLGEGCNGVYTASLNYYGKEPQDLTLAECASVIAITNNPSLYNPYRNPDANLYRRNLCLKLMCEQGMISEAERDAAQAEPLNLSRAEGTDREQVIYSWYEDQVINDVIADLSAQYNLTEKAAASMIYYGGLRIETCFDPEIQAYVDAVYQDRSTLEMDSANGQEIQSAITIIDNRTGNVVALAGGIGEKTLSRSWNRATDTIRPPGSSIKPLAVYAPALELGTITPATVFDDTPINLNGSAWPRNSYGYFKGLITAHEALQDSANTVAVKVLRDKVTPDLSYQFMTERFGITSLVAMEERNGTIFSDIDLAPLALGGLTDGVSTYEMAAAYATFANNGMYRPPRTYLRVTDPDGRVLLENVSSSQPVLKESTVFYINTMLQSVVRNGTGRHDAYFSGMTIAGKTGTTSSNNDKWFVGYSAYYTAAVWVGYDIQERIPTNGYLAAQMWRKVMEPLHENLEDQPFYQPDNLVSVGYCKASGLRATEWCAADPRGSQVTTGVFVSGDQPSEFCTVHVPVEVCLDDPILNDDGAATGLYHMAGPFCPEDRISTIAMLDYDRERVTSSVYARDDAYLLSSLEALANGGACTVHTEAPPVDDPAADFDPLDPSTWPTDDPNFDPLDPATWPGANVGGENNGVTDPPYVDPVTPPPVVTDPPTATDPPAVDPTPTPIPASTPAPDPTAVFDPLDPATWPSNDPNFDPLDPSTWPGANDTGTTGSNPA